MSSEEKGFSVLMGLYETRHIISEMTKDPSNDKALTLQLKISLTMTNMAINSIQKYNRIKASMAKNTQKTR